MTNVETKQMNAPASAPCPTDSALMQAWETYKRSDEYKDQHSWATRYIPDDDPAELERIRSSGANPWTKEMKINAVEGWLWAAFMKGRMETGGTDPYKNSPTLEELERLIFYRNTVPDTLIMTKDAGTPMDVTLKFSDGVPEVKPGHMMDCIVVTERDGKRVSFAAYYLNAYPLGYNDCICETGWRTFYDESNFEYDNFYHPVNATVLLWAPIPKGA
jgi:hypothetical protein